ncbi:MAG: type VI secretion system baseplate subunit TssF [Gammaproteobacteria bacterium]|nr:type VI secretion system baseplate subunit TssF [Gammaproteobacteria bacterium]
MQEDDTKNSFIGEAQPILEKIKQQLNADLSTIYQTLLYKIEPETILPTPARSIAQFNCSWGQILEPYSIPKHSPLLVNNKKQIIKFATEKQLIIYPVRLNTLNITSKQMTLSFEVHKATNYNNLNLKQLTIFVDAQEQDALTFFQIITNTQNIITIDSDISHRLTIEPSFFSDNEAPICLLKKYFAGQSQLLFFTIRTINNTTLPINENKFTINIETKEQIYNNKINAENMKLFCLPITNLFPSASEPILITPEQSEYEIKTTEINNYIYRIENHNQQLILDKQTWLMRPSLITNKKRIITHNLWCYNKLHKLNIEKLTGSLPNFIHIRNLTTQSPYVKENRNTNYQHTLLTILKFNNTLKINLTDIKDLLSAYSLNTTKKAQSIIDAIEDLKIETSQQIYRGALQQEQKFNLTINEKNFETGGDLYLFTGILHKLFTSIAPINCYTTTITQCLPSNRYHLWTNKN